MTKSLPLTDDQVKRLETFQPTEPWQHRAKVVALLCLDGFKLADEILSLMVSDINLELGIAALEGELAPLSCPTIEAIREWLEVRPQRGTEQALITGFNIGPGRHMKAGEPLRFDVARWTKSVLGVAVGISNLHATFYRRMMKKMPGAMQDEIAAALGRSQQWVSYWRRVCQADKSTRS